MVVFSQSGPGYTAQMVCRNRVACLSVEGDVTAESTAAVLRQIALKITDHDMLCTVVHYDRANLLIPFTELFRLTERFQELGVPASSPIGVVVPPNRMDEAKSAFLALRKRGIWREAFCDRGDAEAWALDVSVMVELQQAWRERHVYA